ncbi:ATP-dependent nuclease [Anaerobaca lacustris]|uniref:AAA family ATPase n=1 Tax=Anaerobaca lacustris TaxID=3044600 RepID=A0AAW6U884_9BACT|nr:AAA family ATPase [Sedimentisphaerales bacterium M17dextr]
MGDIDLRGGSVFHRYGEPPAILKATFSNGCEVHVRIGENNQIFGLLFDDSGKPVRTKAVAANIDLPSIAILPQIRPLQESEKLLTEEYVRRSVDTGLSSRHFRNQVHFMRSEYFDKFVQRTEQSWRQLHIESLNIEGDHPDDQYLSFHVRDTDFVAEVGWMGHGLQMWLQTMWFLARSSDAATVILDEPDVYMHADLQRRLIRMLKMDQRQTIVATHSVEIMSEVGPEDIVVVDKTRKQSSVAASLPAVQKTIDQLGGVHNIHLARLWNSRRHLLIEGKDVPLLKVLQNVLSPDSDLPLDIIPNVSVGGWSGWQRAVGSAKSMKNAAGEDIITYCIFDSDYQTEDEINERYEQACEHDINLHIWSEKEIENYLLVPVAIVRVIEGRIPANRHCPTPEDVANQIEKIASSMRDDVFDAMSQQYLAGDRAGGVTAANRKARKRIEKAWQTREGRQRIVSGKRVVSELSKWSKDNFDVSFGAISLARAMTKKDVQKEVRGVIQAIVRGTKIPLRLRSTGD